MLPSPAGKRSYGVANSSTYQSGHSFSRFIAHFMFELLYCFIVFSRFVFMKNHFRVAKQPNTAVGFASFVCPKYLGSIDNFDSSGGEGGDGGDVIEIPSQIWIRDINYCIAQLLFNWFFAARQRSIVQRCWLDSVIVGRGSRAFYNNSTRWSSADNECCFSICAGDWVITDIVVDASDELWAGKWEQ